MAWASRGWRWRNWTPDDIDQGRPVAACLAAPAEPKGTHRLHSLAPQLGTATALVGATVLMHLIGLDLLLTLTGLHVRRFATWVHVDRLIVPLGMVLGLFVLHGLEIWLYAFTYRYLGPIESLEQAVYYSASAYTTLGEAGGTLAKGWRVVGALEAVNGSLLIGWSIALMFSVLSRLLDSDEEDHRVPRGAIARSALRGRQPRTSRRP